MRRQIKHACKHVPFSQLQFDRQHHLSRPREEEEEADDISPPTYICFNNNIVFFLFLLFFSVSTNLTQGDI